MIVPQYLFEYVQEIGVIQAKGAPSCPRSETLRLCLVEGQRPLQSSPLAKHPIRSRVSLGHRLPTRAIERQYERDALWNSACSAPTVGSNTPLGRPKCKVVYSTSIVCRPDDQRILVLLDAWTVQPLQHGPWLVAGRFVREHFGVFDSTGVKPFDALELNPLMGVNWAVRGFRGPRSLVA